MNRAITFFFLAGILLLTGSGCVTTPQTTTKGKLPSCCAGRVAEVKPSDKVLPNAKGAPIGSDISTVGYDWQNDRGETVKLSSLKGKLQVVSMFFATCQGICLITREEMEKIEASLDASTLARSGFVLVTLDPSRDSYKSLAEYRATQGLSASRWTLMRGDADSTRRIANYLGVTYGRDSAGRFVHTSELVVLNEQGRVVGRHSGVRKDMQSILSELRSVTTAEHLAVVGDLREQ